MVNFAKCSNVTLYSYTVNTDRFAKPIMMKAFDESPTALRIFLLMSSSVISHPFNDFSNVDTNSAIVFINVHKLSRSLNIDRSVLYKHIHYLIEHHFINRGSKNGEYAINPWISSRVSRKNQIKVANACGFKRSDVVKESSMYYKSMSNGQKANWEKIKRTGASYDDFPSVDKNNNQRNAIDNAKALIICDVLKSAQSSANYRHVGEYILRLINYPRVSSKINIKDVANNLGVTHTTVSRALKALKLVFTHSRGRIKLSDSTLYDARYERPINDTDELLAEAKDDLNKTLSKARLDHAKHTDDQQDSFDKLKAEMSNKPLGNINSGRDVHINY